MQGEVINEIDAKRYDYLRRKRYAVHEEHEDKDFRDATDVIGLLAAGVKVTNPSVSKFLYIFQFRILSLICLA